MKILREKKAEFSLKRIIFASFGFVLLTIIYMFVEPYLIEIKEYHFPVGIAKPVKIVFITDIHHGPFFAIARVHHLVELVNAQQPDIVLLGGDYVHRDSQYIPPVFNELKNIKSKVFIAGVLGNHDHWESKSLSIQNMKKAGIYYLDNKSINLTINHQMITISGVGDLWEDQQNLDELKTNKIRSAYNILVTHNPDFIEKLDSDTLDKIDLVLAGHTHGGQVSLFGLWAPLVPSKYGQKYRTGLKYKNKTKIIISNGIGTITPPVRFFARPLIIVVHLMD